jgi:MSHA biogenesis protein MshJ
MIRQWLKQLAARLDALTLRERGFVLIAIVAVLFMLWDTFMMQPLYHEQEANEQKIAGKRESIDRLAQTLQQVTQRSDSNPNERLQSEQQELRRQIAQLDERLGAETANIISPRRMATVLQEVLRRQSSLQLIAVRSLPAEPVLALDSAEDATLPGNIYRHGIEIEVEGRYLDLLAYLRDIEGLPHAFVWDQLEIAAEKYPRNRIRFRVYTLSLSEGLIGA